MKRTFKYDTIAEMTDGIILAEFKKEFHIREGYQSESELESEMISNLEKQGYENLGVKTSEDLLLNLKRQLENLNSVKFTDSEWQRFLSEYLNPINDGVVEKTKKIQDDYIYDFTFDKGYIENIKIIDKDNIYNNKLQVTSQFTQVGKHKNRYDVTILINGLPLVQVELKRRGVNLTEAFNQIHRYSSESFNHDDSLFKFIQIFVISNGTNTKYFANTTSKVKKNYEFACEWADSKNNVIHDLVDFTRTFFEKRVLLELLTKYCIFNSENELLIMRPYQIAAAERIIWKIKGSYNAKAWGKVNSGGYIWHTTGSGKTLTSFKAAKIATSLEYIDKVFFIVDRKDLDYQTMKEYKKFQEDSVSGSKDTKALKRNIENDEGKIIVTTIQKFNQFIKKNPKHKIYDKHCVLIFDECHRSQFGEIQGKITSSFKKYYQFGFTGTPIFAENANRARTTADVFGVQLHSYVITDAIRDKKVLKFNVDYKNASVKFKENEKLITSEKNESKLRQIEKELLLHPERIEAITSHILQVFNQKTHRNECYSHNKKRVYGFNAMFAVQNIQAAKLYYEEFVKQQTKLPNDKKLTIATIYSFAANEEKNFIGEISDESFETSALDSTSKEFLNKVIQDYNEKFKTNFSTEATEFQNYYKDLSNRVKNKEVDILIVVGMFLTGFDAPALNTLFVDKNLSYHGLIQAYSRTNRIFNAVKSFGNIVCFRNLEEATKEAIRIFGDENSSKIILEKSYKKQMDGFIGETGEQIKGYKNLCNEILEKFPNPVDIVLEQDKKEFCQLFGEILKAENVLKNYDEFYDEEPLISESLMQDMRSVYVDIREEIQREKKNKESEVDFADIEFQIDLLKTDEINLDYILKLILQKTQNSDNLDELKDDIRRIIKANMGTRAKEDLIIDFVDSNDFSDALKNEDIIEMFYTYAKKQKEIAIEKLITEEKLKDNARRYIEKSIEKGIASAVGIELDSIIPPTSRMAGARDAKKQQILLKIQKLSDIFVEI